MHEGKFAIQRFTISSTRSFMPCFSFEFGFYVWAFTHRIDGLAYMEAILDTCGMRFITTVERKQFDNIQRTERDLFSFLFVS